MSSFLRKVKKSIDKAHEKEYERMMAVAGWLETYGHNYPNFIELSSDPVKALLEMMQDYDTSVVQAAKISEEFAIEWQESQPKG